MRAVVATGFGDPGVLKVREEPEPVAGPGQVVVEVSVSPIDFIQTQFRRGVTPGPPLPEPPYLAGGGVAGRVRAVGQGVAAGLVGSRVVARTADGLGGHAERAVAEAGALIPVPGTLTLPAAAALLDDGSTAIGLAEGAAIRPGEWVLVEAASGGLGSLLVQLARAAGAHVIGAARGERKLTAVRKLGADAAVDYSEPGWTDLVRELTGGAGPDLVFDGVGGDIGTAAFEVTARGGRFSIHGASSGTATAPDPDDVAAREVTVLPLAQLFGFGPHHRLWAEQALAEAVAGRLTPQIGAMFPLERADEAHAAIEARTIAGKTLLFAEQGGEEQLA